MWGYYGTQYRVRLSSPFGYSILYKEHDLTRFNHQPNPTHLDYPEGSEDPINRVGGLYRDSRGLYRGT